MSIIIFSTKTTIQQSYWDKTERIVPARERESPYFFMKDKVKTWGLKVEYCPTAEMIADLISNHYKENISKTLENWLLGIYFCPTICDNMIVLDGYLHMKILNTVDLLYTGYILYKIL